MSRQLQWSRFPQALPISPSNSGLGPHSLPVPGRPSPSSPPGRANRQPANPICRSIAEDSLTNCSVDWLTTAGSVSCLAVRFPRGVHVKGHSQFRADCLPCRQQSTLGMAMVQYPVPLRCWEDCGRKRRPNRKTTARKGLGIHSVPG